MWACSYSTGRNRSQPISKTVAERKNRSRTPLKTVAGHQDPRQGLPPRPEQLQPAPTIRGLQSCGPRHLQQMALPAKCSDKIRHSPEAEQPDHNQTHSNPSPDESTSRHQLPAETATSRTSLWKNFQTFAQKSQTCLLYTSPSPRDRTRSRMPSSA